MIEKMTTIKLLPLWLIIFISFFCYSSMLTMFVPMLQDSASPLYELTKNEIERNILSGVFLALYPLGQFIGSPIIGALSDKYGRKSLINKSLLITTVCLLLIAYAIWVKSLILIAIGCLIAGLCESNMTLALSSLADITADDERVTAFSRAWVMCSVGYILGSLFGGIPYFIGYVFPFIMEAILVFSVLSASILWFVDSNKISEAHNLSQILKTFMGIFSKNPLRPYYGANFLFYFAFFGVLRVQIIYMHDVFLLNQAQIAIFSTYASIIAMFANFIVTPILIKRWGLNKIIFFSASGSIISCLLFINFTNWHSLYFTVALIGFFIPILVALVGAKLSSLGEMKKQGAIMGNNQSLQVLAEASSALLGGLLFNLSDKIPFLLFAIVGLSGLIIFRGSSKSLVSLPE
ncbi:MAG: MFS transporter [Burkholderiales bacterium]|nr:MFS transporter [Burkholderiales bacterium]